MNLFYIGEAGDKGAGRPFPLHPKSPLKLLRFAPDGPALLDDSEHLLHNHHASVALLRLLFTFERNAVRLPSGISVHLHRNTQAGCNPSL
jgi:hypothetical protein